MASDTKVKCVECNEAFSVFDENSQAWAYHGDFLFCPVCGAKL